MKKYKNKRTENNSEVYRYCYKCMESNRDKTNCDKCNYFKTIL